MAFFTRTLLKKLGLFRPLLVPTSVLSPNPPGNIQFVSGQIQFIREELRPGGEKKKDIIITDPSYHTDPLTKDDIAEQLFWNYLWIHEFNIFVWTGKLTPVANFQELMTVAIDVKPISSGNLVQATGKDESDIYILDTETNNKIFKLINEIQYKGKETFSFSTTTWHATGKDNPTSMLQFAIYLHRMPSFAGRTTVQCGNPAKIQTYSHSIGSRREFFWDQRNCVAISSATEIQNKNPIFSDYYQPTRYLRPAIFLFPNLEPSVRQLYFSEMDSKTLFYIKKRVGKPNFAVDLHFDANSLSELAGIDIHPRSIQTGKFNKTRELLTLISTHKNYLAQPINIGISKQMLTMKNPGNKQAEIVKNFYQSILPTIVRNYKINALRIENQAFLHELAYLFTQESISIDSLRELYITNILFNPEESQAAAYFDFLHSFPNLRSLEMQLNTQKSWQNTPSLHFPYLEELTLTIDKEVKSNLELSSLCPHFFTAENKVKKIHLNSLNLNLTFSNHQKNRALCHAPLLEEIHLSGTGDTFFAPTKLTTCPALPVPLMKNANKLALIDINNCIINQSYPILDSVKILRITEYNFNKKRLYQFIPSFPSLIELTISRKTQIRKELQTTLKLSPDDFFTPIKLRKLYFSVLEYETVLLFHLMKNCPSLEDITIVSQAAIGDSSTGTPISYLYKDGRLPNVKSFSFSTNHKIGIYDIELMSFLFSMPNLEYLYAGNIIDNIPDLKAIPSFSLPKLTTFYFKPSKKCSWETLHFLLSTMPSLEKLTLLDIPKGISIKETPLFLPNLKILTIKINVAWDELQWILQAAPSLSFLNLDFRQLSSSTVFFDNQLASTQDHNSHLTIKLPRNPRNKKSLNAKDKKDAIQAPSKGEPLQDQFRIDISTDTAISGQVVFDAPTSLFYDRNNVYNALTLSETGWKPYSSTNPLHFVDTVPPYLVKQYYDQTLRDNLTSTARTDLQLDADNCIPLPSLTAYDTLINFYSTKAISIYYSPSLHQYCAHGSGTASIQYQIIYKHAGLLTTHTGNAQLIENYASSSTNLNNFIQQLSDAYQTKQTRLPFDLASYFNSFPSNQTYHATPKSADDQLWDLIQHKAGVCYHRSIIYKYILDELNSKHAFSLPTWLIVSGPHAFVETQINGWVEKIDLGGGIVRKYSKMDRLADLDLSAVQSKATNSIYHPEAWTPHEKSSASQTDIIDFGSLKPQHIYSWEEPTDTPPNELDRYCNWVLNQTGNLKLIPFQDKERIDYLAYQFMHTTPDPLYYLRSRTQFNEDITAGKIKNHQIEQVPGLFSRFIEADNQKLLLLNWVNFDATEIAAQKSVFDYQAPAFLNMPINGLLKIIAFIDQTELSKLSEDVISRAKAIPLPTTVENQLTKFFPSGVIDPLNSNCPEVNLYQNDIEGIDWIVGSITADDKEGFLFQSGALVNALKNGHKCLTAVNPPSSGQRFFHWLHTLFKNRAFIANGNSIALPDDFTFQIAYKQLSLKPPKPLPHEQVDQIINSQNYFTFFQHTVYTNVGHFKTFPGLLAEYSNKNLNLLLTSPIRVDQWVRLADTANQRHVSLQLKIAPYVAQPSFYSPIPPVRPQDETLSTHQIPTLKGSAWFYQVDDLDRATLNIHNHLKEIRYKPLVLAISKASTFDDLFWHYVMQNEDIFTISQQPSAAWKHLENGEAVILKGSLSEQLRQQSLTLFQEPPYISYNHQSYQLNGLLVVISSQLHPEFIRDNTIQHIKLTNADNKASLVEMANTITVATVQGLNKAASDQFKASRLQAVLSGWESNPVIFLEGETGTGKTSFVHYELPSLFSGKSFHLYEGIESIPEFLSDQQHDVIVLFIDEANLLQPGSLDFLEGLYTQIPGILYKGVFYPLSSRMKTVLAGNPMTYQGRISHSVLENRVQKIIFPSLPDAYLTHEVLAPIFKATNHPMPQHEMNNLLDQLLKDFQLSQSTEFNVRHLQMMVLRYLVRRKDQPLDHDAIQAIIETEKLSDYELSKTQLERYYPCQTGARKNFYITQSRCTLLQLLAESLAIRKLKMQFPSLTAMGLNGFLVEGESGIGKSTVLDLFLHEHNYLVTHLIPGPWNRVSSDLAYSFDHGQIILLDEINLQTALEEPLNHYLFGHFQNGSFASQPGFFSVATQNPSSYAGRNSLSPALKSRFYFVTLPTYPLKEFIEIATHNGLPTIEAKELTLSYLRHKDDKKLNARHFFTELQQLTPTNYKPQPLLVDINNLRAIKGLPSSHSQILPLPSILPLAMGLIIHVGYAVATTGLTITAYLLMRDLILMRGYSIPVASHFSQIISVGFYFLCWGGNIALTSSIGLILATPIITLLINTLSKHKIKPSHLSNYHTSNIKYSLSSMLIILAHQLLIAASSAFIGSLMIHLLIYCLAIFLGPKLSHQMRSFPGFTYIQKQNDNINILLTQIINTLDNSLPSISLSPEVEKSIRNLAKKKNQHKSKLSPSPTDFPSIFQAHRELQNKNTTHLTP